MFTIEKLNEIIAATATEQARRTNLINVNVVTPGEVKSLGTLEIIEKLATDLISLQQAINKDSRVGHVEVENYVDGKPVGVLVMTGLRELDDFIGMEVRVFAIQK